MTGRRAGRRQTDVDARLDAAYAELPAMECRGKCWDSCGPILMTEAERERIQTRHGVTIPDAPWRDGPKLCPALTMLKRCGVYADRPAICRLWGVVESMPCNYGCRPEGGLWPDRRGYLWLARVDEASGDHQAAARLRADWLDPGVAARSSARLRRHIEQAEVTRQLRQRRATASGSVVYVAGPGRLTRERTEQAQ